MKIKCWSVFSVSVVGSLLLLAVACSRQEQNEVKQTETVERELAKSHVCSELKKFYTANQNRAMQGNGLVGVLGGVNLMTYQKGSHTIQLPMPQLVDNQVPVFYDVTVKPENVLLSKKIQVRDDKNAFLHLTLNSEKDTEISIDWYAVVLISPSLVKNDNTDPKVFAQASLCVQSDSKQIIDLSNSLRPASEDKYLKQYCTNITNFIANMEGVDFPMSLDALGILKSGMNYICTSNANLATAFMRAQKIPCRMLATIPTNAYPLEMHRIVEYYNNDVWTLFDPSFFGESNSLKPHQNVIMVKSSIKDESEAMTPRMCAMLGMPFGQEIEIMSDGLALHGQDFFWTVAFPLAEFNVSDEVTQLTVRQWENFLQTESLTSNQLNAALSSSLDSYTKKLTE